MKLANIALLQHGNITGKKKKIKPKYKTKISFIGLDI